MKFQEYSRAVTENKNILARAVKRIDSDIKLAHEILTTTQKQAKSQSEVWGIETRLEKIQGAKDCINVYYGQLLTAIEKATELLEDRVNYDLDEMKWVEDCGEDEPEDEEEDTEKDIADIENAADEETADRLKNWTDSKYEDYKIAEYARYVSWQVATYVDTKTIVPYKDWCTLWDLNDCGEDVSEMPGGNYFIEFLKYEVENGEKLTPEQVKKEYEEINARENAKQDALFGIKVKEKWKIWRDDLLNLHKQYAEYLNIFKFMFGDAEACTFEQWLEIQKETSTA